MNFIRISDPLFGKRIRKKGGIERPLDAAFTSPGWIQLAVAMLSPTAYPFISNQVDAYGPLV